MPQISPHEKLTATIRNAAREHGVALIAYVVAGYPKKNDFIKTLREVAEAADVVEVGVPFSDPMADGVTIQRASHAAIQQGVSLKWILAELKKAGEMPAPVVLMSYLNPLYAFGYEQLAAAAAESHVSGFIVPDLPLEESDDFRTRLDARGLALINLITPSTPEDRARRLSATASGFIYAVTSKGTTGSASALPTDVTRYLDRIRASASLPVCAGFGVRTPEQVRGLSGHADGVIVGSALVEEVEAGRQVGGYLGALRSRRH
ncbi:MAG: tryptophan synthase subunit alpha [Gammaproteobacteria bacterium]|nr:tryptophan synthase subunit alpha [Gammaproteobacteria bacterium]